MLTNVCLASNRTATKQSALCLFGLDFYFDMKHSPERCRPDDATYCDPEDTTGSTQTMCFFVCGLDSGENTVAQTFIIRK